jgi:4-amino-4-deoxy-L-arabinose transferase-like glycosyltransferase
MKVPNEKILVTIIIIAAILRLIYILITPIDAWETDSSNHALVAKEIATTNEIPTNFFLQIDVFVWYPPLYHFIGAVFYKIIPHIQILQVISAIFGILSLPLAYLTFKKLVNKRAGLLATFFLAIYPLHFRLSTTIMTDATSVFFTFLSLYVFVLWEQTSKKKYSFLLAASLGLLLLAKFTGFVIIGIFFLWKMLIKRKEILKYVFISLIAVLIASPWYVRNYVYSGNPLYFTEASQTQKSRIQVLSEALTKNPQLFVIRFWDSVQSETFIQQKGVSVSLPFVDKILLGYIILASVYFVFFALGFNFKTDAGKLMIVWFLAYVGFSLYFLTSNWDIGYVPRVTTFAIPMFCYLFAIGVDKLLKYRLTFVFLVLTGLMFIGFVGFRLYTGYKNEMNFLPGYSWMEKNIDNHSLVVSVRGSQVSLFSGKFSATAFNETYFNRFNSIYIYNRVKDAYSRTSCPTNFTCKTVYEDAYSLVQRINK